MCHAVPARVVELLEGALARVELSGARQSVSVELIEDEVRPGDYLVVHVGYALGRLDAAEAEATLAALAGVGEAAGDGR